MFIAKVGFKKTWIVLCDECVCSFCIPKLEPPFRVEFCATGIGYSPFLLHGQVPEASLVNDPRNDLRCICWGDKILKIPAVTVTKDGMR